MQGISAFIVEKDFPGFEIGKIEHKMGIRGLPDLRARSSTDMAVPAENLLGAERYRLQDRHDDPGPHPPSIAAQALGIAQGALECAGKCSRQRVQFGKPISSFQGIQWMLADMATEVEAARALVYACARAIDAGCKISGSDSAMAKLFASDVAMKVSTDAVQILGGYGYMKDYPAEKYMRDAKITQIYEGTQPGAAGGHRPPPAGYENVS